MAGFFDRVSDFFARHRAHCAVHEIYQRDCTACVLANQSTSVDWIDTSSSDSICDTSSVDSSSSDTSSSDSSSSDSSDFGGFDGGDSGGGGSSGDF